MLCLVKLMKKMEIDEIDEIGCCRCVKETSNATKCQEIRSWTREGSRYKRAARRAVCFDAFAGTRTHLGSSVIRLTITTVKPRIP